MGPDGDGVVSRPIRAREPDSAGPRSRGLRCTVVLLVLALLVGAAAAPSAAAASAHSRVAYPALPMDDKDNADACDGSEVFTSASSNCWGTGHVDASDEKCDGWGEPAEYCLSLTGMDDDVKITSFKGIEQWAMKQVFKAGGAVFGWWLDVPQPLSKDGGKSENSGTQKDDNNDGGDDILAFSADHLGIVQVFILMVGCIVVGYNTMTRRDGSSFRDMVKGLVVVLFSHAFIVSTARLVIETTDVLSSWYLQEALPNPDPERSQKDALKDSLRRFLFGVSDRGQFVLSLLAAFAVLVFSLVQVAYMWIRWVQIYYLLATFPIIAALSVFGGGGMRLVVDHVRKLFVWIIAYFFWIVLIVIAIRVGNPSADSEPGTAGLERYQGIIVLLIVSILGNSIINTGTDMLGAAGGPSGGGSAVAKALPVGAARAAMIGLGAGYVATRGAARGIGGAAGLINRHTGARGGGGNAPGPTGPGGPGTPSPPPPPMRPPGAPPGRDPWGMYGAQSPERTIADDYDWSPDGAVDDPANFAALAVYARDKHLVAAAYSTRYGADDDRTRQAMTVAQDAHRDQITALRSGPVPDAVLHSTAAYNHHRGSYQDQMPRVLTAAQVAAAGANAPALLDNATDEWRNSRLGATP